MPKAELDAAGRIPEKIRRFLSQFDTFAQIRREDAGASERASGSSGVNASQDPVDPLLFVDAEVKSIERRPGLLGVVRPARIPLAVHLRKRDTQLRSDGRSSGPLRDPDDGLPKPITRYPAAYFDDPVSHSRLWVGTAAG